MAGRPFISARFRGAQKITIGRGWHPQPHHRVGARKVRQLVSTSIAAGKARLSISSSAPANFHLGTQVRGPSPRPRIRVIFGQVVPDVDLRISRVWMAVGNCRRGNGDAEHPYGQTPR